MPERKRIVINTGPIIALAAAIGDLSFLQRLYEEVVVPAEVVEEIRAGGPGALGVAALVPSEWLRMWAEPVKPSPLLAHSLDRGEAAVVQLAIDQHIPTVCIDEAVGRRVARLSGLAVTGSLGVLIRAEGLDLGISVADSIDRMRARGVWLSDRVVAAALRLGRAKTD